MQSSVVSDLYFSCYSWEQNMLTKNLNTEETNQGGIAVGNQAETPSNGTGRRNSTRNMELNNEDAMDPEAASSTSANLRIFGRSAMMNRTPPKSEGRITQQGSAVRNQYPEGGNTHRNFSTPNASQNAGGIFCSLVGVENLFGGNNAAETSRTNGKSKQMETGGVATNTGKVGIEDLKQREEKELSKCKLILERMKAVTTRQRNTSIDVKNGLAELEEVVSAINFFRRKWKLAEQQQSQGETLQGSPLVIEAICTAKEPAERIALQTPTQAENNKRTALSPAEENESNLKKTRGETPNVGWQTQETKGQRRRRKLQEQITQTDTEEPLYARNANTPAKHKNRRSRKRRPEALIIRPAPGQSYADILKEIRSKAKPEESGAEVTAIRQTRSGDVLLELGSKTDNKDGFCEELKTVLGEKGKINSLGSRISVEIRDLDACTSEEEVEEALKRDNPDVGDINITVFATGRSQKVAIIGMNCKSASNLLNRGRIKIGWLYCRVRERVQAVRCFKCLGYGHIAIDCKGKDRSKLCYKCFGEGHKARACATQQHRCVLCLENGQNNAELDHIPGNGKCQVYREALHAARNRL